MGYYINPPKLTKEEFLEKHGRPLLSGEVLAFDWERNELPVCLVDNGLFTAAAIAINVRERDAFLRPNDHRPKVWFAVSTTDLKPYLAYA